MIRPLFWFFLVAAGAVCLYGIYKTNQYTASMEPVKKAMEEGATATPTASTEASFESTPEQRMPAVTQAAELKPPTAQQPTAKVATKKYVELVNPVDFLNSEPITIGQFVGKKVIMVTFITYTCINCQNTFSFLRKMQSAYGNDGLQIIAVHTPEFSYERLRTNVQPALDKAGLTFPVVLDNEYETWRAYNNNYWPARYLIDIQGNITFFHAGEGAYEETEARIVSALEERRSTLKVM